jgi:hypothetical protein
MIKGRISSCLSERDEGLGTPLVLRNSVSIIEVEKEAWKPGSSVVMQHQNFFRTHCLSLSLTDDCFANLIRTPNIGVET